MLRACLAWRCVSWGVEGQERAVEVDGHAWRLDMGWLNFRGLYVARFCGGRRICAPSSSERAVLQQLVAAAAFPVQNAPLA